MIRYHHIVLQCCVCFMLVVSIKFSFDLKYCMQSIVVWYFFVQALNIFETWSYHEMVTESQENILLCDSKYRGEFWSYPQKKRMCETRDPIEFSRNKQSWKCWHCVLLKFENKIRCSCLWHKFWFKIPCQIWTIKYYQFICIWSCTKMPTFPTFCITVKLELMHLQIFREQFPCILVKFQHSRIIK